MSVSKVQNCRSKDNWKYHKSNMDAELAVSHGHLKEQILPGLFFLRKTAVKGRQFIYLRSPLLHWKKPVAKSLHLLWFCKPKSETQPLLLSLSKQFIA